MSARILVVDDDTTIVRLLRMNLELEGYEVVSATNGREALEAIAQHDPDLVLCDVMMPIMDGLEVVSRLKRNPATAALPIVLLSAKAQDVDIRHGENVGADAYVTKPFDPEDLLSTIDRMLAGSTWRLREDEAPPAAAPNKPAAKKKTGGRSVQKKK